MQYPLKETTTPTEPEGTESVNKPLLDDSSEAITSKPEEFDPRLSPTEPVVDPGALAREKVKGRSFKAKVRRAWNWTKAIILLLLLLAGTFLYWQYTVRKHTYVVEPRICFFETADKSIRLTGTRYYSYTQNEMLGYRWAHTDDVSVKTEIDVKGDSMVITGLGGPDGPTSKYVPQGERGVQVLAPATTYVVTLDKRSVVLESNKFCR